jgi:hypothetical protein
VGDDAVLQARVADELPKRLSDFVGFLDRFERDLRWTGRCS